MTVLKSSVGFESHTLRRKKLPNPKSGKKPARRRGCRAKSPSLRDELGRDGCGELGGFVTNQGVRSDFLDERLDLVQIRGGGQKIGLFRI